MGATGFVSASTAAAATSEESTYEVSVVRVLIREADGSVHRAPTRAVRSGEEVAFEVISDLHRHSLAITTGAADVAFSYSRDGAALQTDGSASVSSRRTTVFQDSGATIEVSVVPTKVRVAVDR